MFMYFGAFALLVLPLFLFVSARQVSKSDWSHSVFGIIVEIVLYIFAALSVFFSFAIFAAIARH